jgi:hypothetical protein
VKSFYEFLQAMEMNGVQPTATTPGAPKPGATNTQPEYLNILTAFAANPAAIRSLENAKKITNPNTRRTLVDIATDVATIRNAKKLTGGKSTGTNPVPSAGSGMVGGVNVKPTS